MDKKKSTTAVPTQDEIMQMAREAGAPGWWSGETDSNVPGRYWLSRFAALVAAKAAPSNGALAAPAQPVTWPRNAAEVREFMGAHCQREERANDDSSPSDDDLYALTAYNFLSAVNSWADSPHHPGATQPAQGQEEAVAQAVAVEREACAQLAAQTVCDLHIPTGVKIYGSRAAKAIRARGTDAS